MLRGAVAGVDEVAVFSDLGGSFVSLGTGSLQMRLMWSIEMDVIGYDLGFDVPMV